MIDICTGSGILVRVFWAGMEVARNCLSVCSVSSYPLITGSIRDQHAMYMSLISLHARYALGCCGERTLSPEAEKAARTSKSLVKSTISPHDTTTHHAASTNTSASARININIFKDHRALEIRP